jgi:hypothetical protein
MHHKAKEWEREHGINTSFATGQSPPPGTPAPKNRPCDWCGEIVEEGYIHPQCQELEREFILGIID